MCVPGLWERNLSADVNKGVGSRWVFSVLRLNASARARVLYLHSVHSLNIWGCVLRFKVQLLCPCPVKCGSALSHKPTAFFQLCCDYSCSKNVYFLVTLIFIRPAPCLICLMPSVVQQMLHKHIGNERWWADSEVQCLCGSPWWGQEALPHPVNLSDQLKGQQIPLKCELSRQSRYWVQYVVSKLSYLACIL